MTDPEAVTQAASAAPKRGLAALTPREIDVVAEIADGNTYKATADNLGISYETVAVHLRNVRRKLGVRSKTGLLLWLLRDARDLRKRDHTRRSDE